DPTVKGRRCGSSPRQTSSHPDRVGFKPCVVPVGITALHNSESLARTLWEQACRRSAAKRPPRGCTDTRVTSTLSAHLVEARHAVYHRPTYSFWHLIKSSFTFIHVGQQRPDRRTHLAADVVQTVDCRERQTVCPLLRCPLLRFPAEKPCATVLQTGDGPWRNTEHFEPHVTVGTDIGRAVP